MLRRTVLPAAPFMIRSGTRVTLVKMDSGPALAQDWNLATVPAKTSDDSSVSWSTVTGTIRPPPPWVLEEPVMRGASQWTGVCGDPCATTDAAASPRRV